MQAVTQVYEDISELKLKQLQQWKWCLLIDCGRTFGRALLSSQRYPRIVTSIQLASSSINFHRKTASASTWSSVLWRLIWLMELEKAILRTSIIYWLALRCWLSLPSVNEYRRENSNSYFYHLSRIDHRPCHQSHSGIGCVLARSYGSSWKNEWFILFSSSCFWVEQMDKLFALIPISLVTSMCFFSLSLGLSRTERGKEKNREQRRTRAEQG